MPETMISESKNPIRELTPTELEIVGGGDVDLNWIIQPWHLPIPGQPPVDRDPPPKPGTI